MVCEVFKIVNKISPLFIQDLIALKHTQYSMRQDNSAACTTKYGLRSFMHEGPRVWNSLPNDSASQTILAVFEDFFRTGMVQGVTVVRTEIHDN